MRDRPWKSLLMSNPWQPELLFLLEWWLMSVLWEGSLYL